MAGLGASEMLALVTKAGNDNGLVMRLYEEWAENYDQHAEENGYTPYQRVVDVACRYLSPAESHVLDAPAGTGLGGQQLQARGFMNIDALDGCEVMLKKAKARNIYQNYYCAMMGPNPLPMDKDSYDGVVISGGFAPGHAKGDCLPELIRVTKPGGYIIIAIRAKFMSSPQYQEDVMKPMDDLEKAGRWKSIERDEFSGYVSEDNEKGLLLVYKVL